MSRIPAAAVKAGMEVELPKPGACPGVALAVVRKVHNSTPEAGRITWELANGRLYEIGGADVVTFIPEKGAS
ncbi:MAG: hypothetical protein ACRCZD_12645 [Phycicoccus sp.]